MYVFFFILFWKTGYMKISYPISSKTASTDAEQNFTSIIFVTKYV